MTTTPNTAGSATGIDLDRLEAIAEHIKANDFFASGNELLEMSALARATPQQEPAPTCSEAQADEAKLYRDLTGDALAMGFDGLTAALEALRATPQHPQSRALREVHRQQVDQKLATTGATAYERFLWAKLTRLQAAVIVDAATPQHSVTEQALRNVDAVLEHCQRHHAHVNGTRNATGIARATVAALTQPLASTAATQPEQASIPALPGCLADRLYEAIDIARDRAEHAGSTSRVQKWKATAADLRAALAIPASAKQDVCAEMRALCSACGGTGDVHSIDGEWRGSCDCRASTAASEQQAEAECPTCLGSGYTDAGDPETGATKYDYPCTDCAALTHRATTATYTVDGVVMSPLEYIDHLHTKLGATTAADQQGDTASTSIDSDPEFQRLAEYWRGEPYGTRSFLNAWDELVAYVDGRAQQGAAQAQAGDVARLEFLERCVMQHGSIRASRDRDGTVGSPTFGDLPTVQIFTVPSQHKRGIGLRGAIDSAMAAPATSTPHDDNESTHG